jgi:penicillin-binding protein 1A
MGYDQPRSLGDSAQAAHYTAPIFRDFMKMALAGKPDIPFRAPPGIKLIWVNSKSGMRTSASTAGAIQEAFKPGTAPPDSYAAEDATPRAHSVDHDTDRLVGTGTGGLY